MISAHCLERRQSTQLLASAGTQNPLRQVNQTPVDATMSWRGEGLGLWARRAGRSG